MLKWLLLLVVLGLGLAWMGSRSIDHGMTVLDDAVSLRERERRRIDQLAAAAETYAQAATQQVVTEAREAHRAVQQRLGPAPTTPPKPTPPARPPLPQDLLGARRDQVEARLGSPTGRVRHGDGTEEWWYDRRVLVLRDGRVIHLR